jgi:hypothetical protein
MAAQTCLEKKDVMIGVSIMFFFQGLGGSIWLTVGQTIFSHSLVSYLSTGIDRGLIINTGATELRDLVPPQQLPAVLHAYNAALMNTMKLAVACAAATIIGGLTMEWRSVKGLKQGGPKVSVAEQAVKNDNEAAGDNQLKQSDSPSEKALEVGTPTKI